MLEGMDRSLGDCLAAIDRLGIRDNTVIVFMSDNGSPKQNPPNRPLRGHKISAYEGGTRVPLVVSWLGRTPAGQRTDRPVIIEDVFPTFLELAGITDIPANDGVSFADTLRFPDREYPERSLFWHYPNLYDMPPHSAVRRGDLKLIYWHRTQQLELFNLKEDLSETTDLASANLTEARGLADVLSRHLVETGALMPTLKSSGKAVPLPSQALGIEAR
jgi:arylsulfatase A-like enzyme